MAAHVEPRSSGLEFAMRPLQGVAVPDQDADRLIGQCGRVQAVGCVRCLGRGGALVQDEARQSLAGQPRQLCREIDECSGLPA